MASVSEQVAGPPDEQVGFLLASIVRCKRLWFRNLLAPHAVTPRQYAILARLWERDGRTVNEIARQLFADVTALSRTLGRMERAKLVSRVRCASDRRACEVRLTAKGRTVLERIQPEIHAAERQMLSGLDERAVSTLKQLLRTVLANVAVADGVTIPIDEPNSPEKKS